MAGLLDGHREGIEENVVKLVWPAMGVAGLVALILAAQPLFDGSGPLAEARSVASSTGSHSTVDEPSRPLPTQVDTQSEAAFVETFDPGSLGSLVDAVELRVELPEAGPAPTVAAAVTPAASAPAVTVAPAVAPAAAAPAVVQQPVQRAPSTSVVPAVTGAATTLSASSVYEIALSVSGSESWAAWASRVAACESGNRVNAVGGQGEAGLMQLHPVHFGRWDRALLLTDPAYNLAAAYQLYQSTGPRAWSCA
jgi:hypothetical protein